MADIGMKVMLNMDYDSALETVTEALKTEGFGVLTEIDVKATLKKKLDVAFRPYKILGACNPPLAFKALSAAPDAGMLLPCNVTVSQEEDGRIVGLDYRSIGDDGLPGRSRSGRCGPRGERTPRSCSRGPGRLIEWPA